MMGVFIAQYLYSPSSHAPFSLWAWRAGLLLAHPCLRRKWEIYFFPLGVCNWEHTFFFLPGELKMHTRMHMRADFQYLGSIPDLLAKAVIYSLPIAAVTNQHKLNGLKQHKLILL